MNDTKEKTKTRGTMKHSQTTVGSDGGFEGIPWYPCFRVFYIMKIEMQKKTENNFDTWHTHLKGMSMN